MPASRLSPLPCLFRARYFRSGRGIIVGGNIRHVSRVMTTSCAGTSKGELGIAMALGIVLSIALLVNVASQFISAHFKKAGLDV